MRRHRPVKASGSAPRGRPRQDQTGAGPASRPAVAPDRREPRAASRRRMRHHAARAPRPARVRGTCRSRDRVLTIPRRPLVLNSSDRSRPLADEAPRRQIAVIAAAERHRGTRIDSVGASRRSQRGAFRQGPRTTRGRRQVMVVEVLTAGKARRRARCRRWPQPNISESSAAHVGGDAAPQQLPCVGRCCGRRWFDAAAARIEHVADTR